MTSKLHVVATEEKKAKGKSNERTKTEDVNLIPLTVDYINDVLQTRRECDEWLFTPFFGNESSQQLWYIDYSKGLGGSPKALYFVVDYKGTIVGYATLTSIDMLHCRCVAGVQLKKRFRDKGIGTHAWWKLAEIAFRRLGLNKIIAEVLADNEVSLHVLDSVGFDVEGTLLGHVWHEGAFRNVVTLGLLIDESWFSEDCDF